jgi:hypothetical protein
MEHYRVSVKFPWIDSIWRKTVGVAQFWKQLDTAPGNAVIEEIKQFCLIQTYAHGFDQGSLVCINRLNGRIQLEKIIPLHIAFEPPIAQSKDAPLFGSDPEFILTRNQHPLVAEKYVPLHTEIGTDTIRVHASKTIPALVELRPSPMPTAQAHFTRIRTLVHSLDSYMYDKAIHFIAGSMPFPGLSLGGHLHFSGLICHVDLVRVLDNYLALPLALLENPSELKQRRPRYGRLGDIRFKPHGGFEYRTLPSWLDCPRTAYGVLVLGQHLVQHYPLFQLRLLTGFIAQQAFYQSDIVLLQAWSKSIWEDLYQKRHKFTDFAPISDLFRRILHGPTWSKTNDFRTNWVI